MAAAAAPLPVFEHAAVHCCQCDNQCVLQHVFFREGHVRTVCSVCLLSEEVRARALLPRDPAATSVLTEALGVREDGLVRLTVESQHHAARRGGQVYVAGRDLARCAQQVAQHHHVLGGAGVGVGGVGGVGVVVREVGGVGVGGGRGGST